MWSPGGYDFSNNITDFATFIMSHGSFLFELVIYDTSLSKCHMPSEAVFKFILKCHHAQYFTFTMCHFNILTVCVCHFVITLFVCLTAEIMHF